jgi:hypothetical protein
MELLSIQRNSSIDVWVGHNTLLGRCCINQLLRSVVFECSNLYLLLAFYILDQLTSLLRFVFRNRCDTILYHLLISTQTWLQNLSQIWSLDLTTLKQKISPKWVIQKEQKLRGVPLLQEPSRSW